MKLMPGCSAPVYDAEMLAALEAQAALIKGVFHEKGYRSVEPPVLQPAEVFLNLSGEDIRRRIYVFTDPGGEELCLRPDLTIPTCAMYLAGNTQAKGSAKLCYNGTAFRYQPLDGGRPSEFLQAGVESLGARDREKADAQVIGLAVEACEGAGLQNYKLKIGDVGLFFALINALDIPELWRNRLKRYIWRPLEFEALLARLSGKKNMTDNGPGNGLLNALSRLDEDQARAALDNVLSLAEISPVGVRNAEEIAERLLAQASEARMEALSPKIVKLLNDYLKVSGAPAAALTKIRSLMRKAGVNLSEALERFERRLQLMSEQGLVVSRYEFDADFGRKLEYYTGFVFEITVPAMDENAQIAGGGRYDTLLRKLGAPRDVPAVGCMIRTERLLMAVREAGK